MTTATRPTTHSDHTTQSAARHDRYVVMFASTPLGGHGNLASAMSALRALVKDWRTEGIHPLDSLTPDRPRQPYGGSSSHTAPVRHGRGGDDKAEGGTFFVLKHRGHILGTLRIVRVEDER